MKEFLHLTDFIPESASRPSRVFTADLPAAPDPLRLFSELTEGGKL